MPSLYLFWQLLPFFLLVWAFGAGAKKLGRKESVSAMMGDSFLHYDAIE
jgi:hypothetical protein